MSFVEAVGWVAIVAVLVIAAMWSLGKIQIGRMTEEEYEAELKRKFGND